MNNIDTKLYPQYNFRFSGVKDTFDKYTLGKDKIGNIVAVDRNSGNLIHDELFINRVKFSLSWVMATMKSHSRTTSDTSYVTEQDYEHAFSENAAKTYAIIMSEIQRELTTTGNIDPIDVVQSTEVLNYKYARAYAENLFSQKKFVEATNKWARYAIPNALPQTEELLTYEEAIACGQGNQPRM